MSDFKATGDLGDFPPWAYEWFTKWNWGDGTVTGSLADSPRTEDLEQDLEQDVKTT